MINAIFAVDYNGGLGFNGGLPWPHLREDMQRFQELTTDHVVVMGHKTWNSLPAQSRPLPNRINVVATNGHIPGVRTIRGNLIERVVELEHLYPKRTIWLIGGKEILEICRPLCNNLYITHVKGNYRSDVRIDLRDYLVGFRTTSAGPSQDRTCNFMTYKNILPPNEDLPQRPTTNS